MGLVLQFSFCKHFQRVACRQSLARQVVAGLGRPALHARTLAFDHPASGKRLSFEVALPHDMQSVLQLMEGPGWE